MELFKSDILRKEYNDFVKNTLPKLVICNYCNKVCCNNHYQYEVTCIRCRNEKCKNCYTFNAQIDVLMNGAVKKTKEYIYNFIMDFFSITDESMLFFYKIKNEIKNDNVDLSELLWRLNLHDKIYYKSEATQAKNLSYKLRNKRHVYFLK